MSPAVGETHENRSGTCSNQSRSSVLRIPACGRRNGRSQAAVRRSDEVGAGRTCAGIRTFNRPQGNNHVRHSRWCREIKFKTARHSMRRCCRPLSSIASPPIAAVPLQRSEPTQGATSGHAAVQFQKIRLAIGFADLHHLLLQPLEPWITRARGTGQHTDGEFRQVDRGIE